METKVNSFRVLQVVEIPSSFLGQEIVESLRKAERLAESDEEIDSIIFDVDDLVTIIEEDDISEEGLKTVKELLDEIEEYDLFRITGA